MGDSSLESWVHRILRIPPEPKIPQGSSGSTQVFRAGKNYYWWRLFIWFIGHFFVGIGLFALYGILSRPLMHAPYWVAAIVHFLEAFALAVFLFSAFVNYYSQRLNYRLRWYIITDRSLRIRKGVIGVEELTMTFSNIQEIRIKAGPLQNLLRIADVEVHSAGGATGEPRRQRPYGAIRRCLERQRDSRLPSRAAPPIPRFGLGRSLGGDRHSSRRGDAGRRPRGTGRSASVASVGRAHSLTAAPILRGRG